MYRLYGSSFEEGSFVYIKYHIPPVFASRKTAQKVSFFLVQPSETVIYAKEMLTSIFLRGMMNMLGRLRGPSFFARKSSRKKEMTLD